MLICQSCNESFPFWVTIGGKKRNLNNRKYCLDCSPFGLHNTFKIENGISTRPAPKSKSHKSIFGIRQCNACGKDYNNKGKVCMTCQVAIRRIKVKIKAVEYLGGKCSKCGYKKCMQALKFHHKDPATKDFEIGDKRYYGFEKLKPELDKCELLCGNCHDEEHWTEFNKKYSAPIGI